MFSRKQHHNLTGYVMKLVVGLALALLTQIAQQHFFRTVFKNRVTLWLIQLLPHRALGHGFPMRPVCSNGFV